MTAQTKRKPRQAVGMSTKKQHAADFIRLAAKMAADDGDNPQEVVDQAYKDMHELRATWTVLHALYRRGLSMRNRREIKAAASLGSYAKEQAAVDKAVKREGLEAAEHAMDSVLAIVREPEEIVDMIRVRFQACHDRRVKALESAAVCRANGNSMLWENFEAEARREARAQIELLELLQEVATPDWAHISDSEIDEIIEDVGRV